MIPVLIAPVVGHPEKLSATLASVDVPIGRLVVVDMTPKGLFNEWGAEIIRPLQSVGLAGAINLGITQTPAAPWWLFVTDIVFGSGDCEWIADAMEADQSPCFVTGDRLDDRLLRNAYGAMNVACIDAVGLLDEWAFMPLYFDDDDWERRCRLGGVEWVEYNGHIAHERSTTIATPEVNAQNVVTFAENRRRYIEKWGGPVGAETFTTPYDKGLPLWYTKPDLPGRASRTWTMR